MQGLSVFMYTFSDEGPFHRLVLVLDLVFLIFFYVVAFSNDGFV